MSRALSVVARQASYAQETGEVFLALLTISQADLASPIRIVNNYENVTSNGNLYVGFPFEIDLPDDKMENIPRVTLKIDNVDRSIVEAVRTMTSPATITLDIVLASQPNTVEASFGGFVLRDVGYDALTVQGALAMEDVLNEPYPADSFTPNFFPGLF